MKIVVDIDEDTYKDIKKGKVYSSIRDVPQESVLAIANGTPLPEWLKELEKLKSDYQKLYITAYTEGYEDAKAIFSEGREN